MRACVAWAYLLVFCKASRQQKYTAASVSWPNRSMPSASTATGRADLLAWAPSAAARPRSASSGGEVAPRAGGVGGQLAEDLWGRRQVLAGGPERELEGQGPQVLLGAVVDVAFKPPPRLILRGDQPLP